ncbi:MAG TPA: T9SS type A sorting domain-containing protein [Rubricoccaceae bacterium]|nr:T9SS type A sorting domain-containing protein [Rubricoccaceae bacterium]
MRYALLLLLLGAALGTSAQTPTWETTASLGTGGTVRFVAPVGADTLAVLLERGDGSRAIALVDLTDGGLREVALPAITGATVHDFAVRGGRYYAVANADVVAFDGAGGEAWRHAWSAGAGSGLALGPEGDVYAHRLIPNWTEVVRLDSAGGVVWTSLLARTGDQFNFVHEGRLAELPSGLLYTVRYQVRPGGPGQEAAFYSKTGHLDLATGTAGPMLTTGTRIEEGRTDHVLSAYLGYYTSLQNGSRLPALLVMRHRPDGSQAWTWDRRWLWARNQDAETSQYDLLDVRTEGDSIWVAVSPVLRNEKFLHVALLDSSNGARAWERTLRVGGHDRVVGVREDRQGGAFVLSKDAAPALYHFSHAGALHGRAVYPDATPVALTPAPDGAPVLSLVRASTSEAVVVRYDTLARAPWLDRYPEHRTWNVRRGESETDSVRLFNRGTAPLQLSSIVLGGNGSVCSYLGLEITGGGGGRTVEAGDSTSVILTFAPPSSPHWGYGPCWLRIESDAGTAYVAFDLEAPPATASEDTPPVPRLTVTGSNPVHATAALRVVLPAPGPARLAVYDVLGREVAVLAQGMYAAGTHELLFDTSTLPSGAYFVRAEAGGVAVTRPLTVVR